MPKHEALQQTIFKEWGSNTVTGEFPVFISFILQSSFAPCVDTSCIVAQHL
jgi:hypothetical protein